MEQEFGFRVGDVATLCLYFVGIIGLGIWTTKKIKETEDFFVGGRSMPGWAVGLSMLGTAISSVTFLAYPGSAFEGNWSRLVPGLMLPIAAIVGITFFVVFYRRSLFVSAYQYFERRFGVWGRTYGCIICSLGSFYRMGTILFLLSLPIRVLTGWDLLTIIIAVGVLVTIYTVLGGIEAVIWTDVVQTFFLVLGGLVTIAVIFLKVPGGAPEVIGMAAEAGKFDLTVSFDFNFAKATFWMFALTGIVGNIQEFSADQIKIQRYAAPKTDGMAKRAALTVGLGCIPIWSLFMFVGTCIWVFYHVFPESLISGVRADEVYPHFILTQLPVGLGGFVIAAVMAAAMSSIDSSMNASATVITVDIYKRLLVKNKTDQHYLKTARIITVFAGLFMIVCAWSLTLLNMKTFLDIGFFLGAVFAGGLGGLFLLGFFFKRTNSQGAIIGIGTAVLVILWCTLSHLGVFPKSIASPIHPFVINVAGNFTALIVGYIASLFFPAPSKKLLAGATWWTRGEKRLDV